MTVVVAADGLAKSFGATRALVDAGLEVRAGEVHTVMGENGSGKSTLVKILAGVHRPDHGTLQVAGVPAALRSPSAARALGVATVFQEVLTVPGRSIGENVCLGAPRSRNARARAGDVVARLLGSPVDLDRPVDDLPLSGRQACCVARSLLADPAVLVLDESTSALDVATRDRLFAMVRKRTAGGTAVVFISHRMDEVFKISDVITVLRSGSTVAHRIPMAETSVPQLIGLMSGSGHRTRAAARRPAGAVVLAAGGVVPRAGAAPVDLDLRAGELVGLAGLEGQGQDAFLRALRGEHTDGSLTRAGAVPVDSPAAARRLGIAYVPRERRHEALFEPLSVRENFALPTLAQDTWGGLLSIRRTDARFARHAGRLKIRMGGAGDPVSTLSGGNQQKVVIARALAERPAVLLLNDPTRGIDVGAKQDLYALLEDLCARGTAVVLLSSEVEELVELADRVLVFRGSSPVHLDRDELSRSAVVAACFGRATGEVLSGA